MSSDGAGRGRSTHGVSTGPTGDRPVAVEYPWPGYRANWSAPPRIAKAPGRSRGLRPCVSSNGLPLLEQPLLGERRSGDILNVLLVDGDLHAEGGEILRRERREHPVQQRLERLGVADRREIVVAHERGHVLGRLGVLVVLEQDEPELGDRRL